MTHFPRKKHRLDPAVYQEPLAASITINTHKRQRFFTDEKLAHACMKALSDTAAKHRWLIHIYCFMPDHLHLLVETRETNDLLAFMNLFKQKTSFQFQRAAGLKSRPVPPASSGLAPDSPGLALNSPGLAPDSPGLALNSKEPDATAGHLWHRSYMDCLVRNEESMNKIFEYIMNNPVKAGIVKDPLDYPFMGSSVYPELFNRNRPA